MSAQEEDPDWEAEEGEEVASKQEKADRDKKKKKSKRQKKSVSRTPRNRYIKKSVSPKLMDLPIN